MDLQTARVSLALDEFEVPTPQKRSVPELSAYASVVLTDLPRSLDLPMGSFLPHITKNRLIYIGSLEMRLGAFDEMLNRTYVTN